MDMHNGMSDNVSIEHWLEYDIIYRICVKGSPITGHTLFWNNWFVLN